MCLHPGVGGSENQKSWGGSKRLGDGCKICQSECDDHKDTSVITMRKCRSDRSLRNWGKNICVVVCSLIASILYYEISICK